jgi:hypothetical protein
MSEITVTPFNQTSWDAWQARGRAADVAFAHRVRVLALALGAIAVLAAVWTTLI